MCCRLLLLLLISKASQSSAAPARCGRPAGRTCRPWLLLCAPHLPTASPGTHTNRSQFNALCSTVWTGYQQNLNALNDFTDACVDDSTLPECAAAQRLGPFRYIVSSASRGPGCLCLLGCRSAALRVIAKPDLLRDGPAAS